MTLGHFVKQIPCKVELSVAEVARNHGVVGDRVWTRDDVEDAESQVAVAIAHVGGDGLVPFHNAWVFVFDFDVGFWW